MSDRSLAEQFLDELPRYEHLGDVVKVRLEAALRAAGVKVESVVSRTKDLDSFLKKTIRKTYDDPMSQITDKVGVRVIVSRQVDVPAVDAVVASSFDVREREDKADNLAEDQLGYLGLHFLVAGDDSFPTDQFDLVGRICEIQIHTQVQNAWATVSHH